MTVDATYTFDALTEGATFTAGGGLTINGTAPVVGAASAAHGAMGVHWSAGTAGRVMYDYGSDQTARSVVSSGYFKIATFSAAHMYLGAIYSLQTGGVAQGDWRVNLTTNTVTIRNGATAALTSTYVILANTWYRYEWKITDSTNTQQLKIFVGESTTAVVDLTSTAWTLAANRVVFVGPYITAAGFDVHMDTLRFADDFVGPYATGAPPQDPIPDVLLDFDALTEAATVTVSAPWSISGVAPVAANAAARHGARGARWSSTATAGRLQYDTGANQNELSLVMSSYFRINTMSSVALYFAAILSLTSGGTSQGDLRVNTNGTVTARNGTTVAASGTYALTTGVWYRVDWEVNDATDSQSVRIFLGDEEAWVDSFTGTWTSTLTRVLAFGPATGAAGGALDMDTLRLSAAFPGAFAPYTVRARFRKTDSGMQPVDRYRI